MSEFSTVVADPAWKFKNPGEFTSGGTPIARGAGSKARYGDITTEELCELAIQDHLAKNAHLWFWTTNTHLLSGEAGKVVEAWGFRPITVITWVKTTDAPVICKGCRDFAKQVEGEPEEWATSLPVGVVRASGRTGFYFRGATEHCVFAVRGSQKLLTSEALPTAWLWPRKPHSVKPDAFYDFVERCSPGPYLELFSRRNRLGWETASLGKEERVESLAHVVIGENDEDVVPLRG